MPDWKGIVGNSYDANGFDSYCHALRWSAWRPSFIVLHNTAAPTLAQRPNGFTKQHILNLEGFYRDTQGWKAGPHLFIDDKQIWVFTRRLPCREHIRWRHSARTCQLGSRSQCARAAR